MNKKIKPAINEKLANDRIIPLYKFLGVFGIFISVIGFFLIEFLVKKYIVQNSNQAYFIFAFFIFLWSLFFLLAVKRVNNDTSEVKKQYNKNIKKDLITFIILLSISITYSGVKYFLYKEADSNSSLFYYISMCSEYLFILVVSEIAVSMYNTFENNKDNFAILKKVELYIDIMLLPLLLLLALSNYIIFYLLPESYFFHIFLIISSLCISYLIKIFNYSKIARANTIVNTKQHYQNNKRKTTKKNKQRNKR